MSSQTVADREWKKSFTRENKEGGRRLLWELRHKSSKEVALAHKAMKEAKAASEKKRAKDEFVWRAVDGILRNDPHDWNGHLYERPKNERVFLIFKAGLDAIRLRIAKVLCKTFGHSWSKEIFTKYSPAPSLWERQLQAMQHPYQYHFRCTRFGCQAEKPRE